MIGEGWVKRRGGVGESEERERITAVRPDPYAIDLPSGVA